MRQSLTVLEHPALPAQRLRVVNSTPPTFAVSEDVGNVEFTTHQPRASLSHCIRPAGTSTLDGLPAPTTSFVSFAPTVATPSTGIRMAGLWSSPTRQAGTTPPSSSNCCVDGSVSRFRACASLRPAPPTAAGPGAHARDTQVEQLPPAGCQALATGQPGRPFGTAPSTLLRKP